MRALESSPEGPLAPGSQNPDRAERVSFGKETPVRNVRATNCPFFLLATPLATPSLTPCANLPNPAYRAGGRKGPKL